MPRFAAADRIPEITEERFGMIPGIQNAVILSEQFLA